MANAAATLKAQLDGIMWSYYCQFIEAWQRRNPEGTVAELLEEFRRRAGHASAVAVQTQMSNGSTLAEATRTVSLMTELHDAAEGTLNT